MLIYGAFVSQKEISRTFVFIDTEQLEIIIGFFTLTLCEVRVEKLPLRFNKKYPRIVPGIKLARLAVNTANQRQGVGQVLLFEATKRALVVAENAGSIGLFVDAFIRICKNLLRTLWLY